MDKKLFSFSFVVSSLVYFLLVFTLIFFMSKKEPIKNIDAIISQNVIVEIENLNEQNTEQVIQKTQEILKKIEIPQKMKKMQIEPKVDPQKLFTEIKPKVSKELFKFEQNNDFAKKITQEVKSPEPAPQKKFEFIKETRQNTPDISNQLKTIESKKEQHSSQKNLTSINPDPYYSKIYEIFNARWKPNSLAQILTAKVIVIINANGKFDYVIVQKSSNLSFNNQLILFLESQKKFIYPPFKDGVQTSIEVNFTSEGI